MATNTHTYDGKLNKIFKHDTPYNKEMFDVFYSRLTSPNAKKMSKIIEKNGSANNDKANGINALSLLMYIISKDVKGDIFKNLEEQLSDILTSGQCAQGRTTRLIQIYNLIKY